MTEELWRGRKGETEQVFETEFEALRYACLLQIRELELEKTKLKKGDQFIIEKKKVGWKTEFKPKKEE